MGALSHQHSSAGLYEKVEVIKT